MWQFIDKTFCKLKNSLTLNIIKFGTTKLNKNWEAKIPKFIKLLDKKLLMHIQNINSAGNCFEKNWVSMTNVKQINKFIYK